MGKKLIKNNSLNVKRANASLRRAFIRAPGISSTEVIFHKTTLYRYVYSSAVSFACAFVLLVSFLMQGFYVVYADEETVSSVDVAESVAPVSENITVTENVANENGETLEKPVTDITVQDNTENSSDTTLLDVENVINENNDTSSQSESINSTEEYTAEEDYSVSTSTNADLDTQILTSSSTLSKEVVSSTTASTTHESVSVTESDDAIVFSKDDCTKLEDGSFYCREIQEDYLQDALFSARDQDGDLEIFLIRDGKQAQITENLADDASPYFDEISNTLVWQRLIDDRFQIISYDIESGEEMQITDGTVNNMQPTRQGKYTVWQSWLNDSWNIVLYDGKTQKEITNDKNHNIAPHIQGSLIVWNKTSLTGEKTIEMYNIDSGAYVTVNDPDGLTVDNPRMVLVYDSIHPNGDIVTKGFDIFTGEFIQLDTLPKPLPEIPDSETTTEVKALIQTKPEVKSVLDIDLPDGNTNIIPNNNEVINDLDLSNNSSSSTTTSDMTLDLRDGDVTDVHNDENLEIPDLIIPSYTENIPETSTSTNDV